eukprot:scaffold38344_cov59-Phaeocystis_antarctica.AAC.1
MPARPTRPRTRRRRPRANPATPSPRCPLASRARTSWSWEPRRAPARPAPSARPWRPPRARQPRRWRERAIGALASWCLKKAGGERGLVACRGRRVRGGSTHHTRGIVYRPGLLSYCCA